MAGSVSAESHLLRFYRGLAPDDTIRVIEEMWNYDQRRLEMVHDYIQWLFPNPEPSRFNADAPLLTPADVAAFRTDPDLRARLLRSLDVMLNFYGLKCEQNLIERGPAFASRARAWLTPTNHNYLRLTRILICLSHCGLEEIAHILLACLENIAAHEGVGVITPRTLDFWRAGVAASAPDSS